MRVSTLVLLLALTAGALPAGCVEDVRFNPSGCDVHVRGRWLVDGQNPTAEICGEHRIWSSSPSSTSRSASSGRRRSLPCDATQRATPTRRSSTDGRVPRHDPGDAQSLRRNGQDSREAADPSRSSTSPAGVRPPTSSSSSTAHRSKPPRSRPSTVAPTCILDVGTVDFRTIDAGVECPAP